MPDSVADCPLATVEGLAAKLVVDAHGDWCEDASAPPATAKNPATTKAVTRLAGIR